MKTYFWVDGTKNEEKVKVLESELVEDTFQ